MTDMKAMAPEEDDLEEKESVSSGDPLSYHSSSDSEDINPEDDKSTIDISVSTHDSDTDSSADTDSPKISDRMTCHRPSTSRKRKKRQKEVDKASKARRTKYRLEQRKIRSEQEGIDTSTKNQCHESDDLEKVVRDHANSDNECSDGQYYNISI
jgi:hypothetical protein